MKYLYNSLLLIISFFYFSIAQSQTAITPKGLINPSFGVNGGDVYAEYIATTDDGYTYTAGQFTNTVDFDFTPDTFNLSSTYGYNMFVAKYDKQSHLIFAFKLSGLSGFDLITAITTDKNDNVYVTGFFEGTVDFDPGPGIVNLSTDDYSVSNLFFAKYDKNGNYIFAKPIVSHSTNVEGSLSAILVDKNSSIVIAGSGKPQSFDFDPGPKAAHPQSHGKYDAFFARYDSLGNYIFSKAVGSTEDDFCNGIALNKNSDIVISGSFANSVNDFDPNAGNIVLPYKGRNDAFVGIYDSLGNYNYAFSFGGVKDDGGYSVATDNDNNIIVSGSFYGNVDFAPDSSVVRKSSDSDYDYFIAKYTQNAKILFVSIIHTDSQEFTPLVLDSLNNIYIGGGFLKSVSFNASDSLVSKGGYDVFIAKYNSKGAYNFSNQISGSNNEILYALSLKTNNQICVAGNYSGTSYFNSSNTKKLVTLNSCSFIAVYNTSTGNNISVNSLGTYRKFNVESAVVKLAHDDQNNTYVAGTFQGVVDFDPGIKQYFLTSSQDANSEIIISLYKDDIFFVKYDANGKLIFAKDIGGTAGQAPISIAVDNNHNIYLTGAFTDTIDVDPGRDSVLLYKKYNTSAYYAFFFGKYDSLGNYIFAKPLYIRGSLGAATIDKNNNLYIAGNFSDGYFDADNDTNNISVPGSYLYFAKYNKNGKFIYLKSVGQRNKGQSCSDISVNKKGNLVLCGIIQGDKIDFDPGPNTHYVNAGAVIAHYVASYSSTGNFLFESNSISVDEISKIYVTKLNIDTNDNILTSGFFTGKVLFDSTLDSLYGPGTNFLSGFIMKYNSKGKALFVKTFSDTKPFYDFQITTSATDNNGNIYIAGNLFGEVDFDPGDDTAFLIDNTSMNSGGNAYLAKYDSLGNYLYAYSFAETDSFFQRGINVPHLWINKNSEIIYAVNTNGNIDFDPGPDTFYYHPPFDVYPTEYLSYSFVLVKFKQTEIVKPFTIYALSSKPDIDKMKTFNLNKLEKYLK